MNNKEVSEYVAEQIQGWIGNLMRDLDAQGTPIEIDHVIYALELVRKSLWSNPTAAEFDAFLRDLNDGRGHE